MRARQQRRKGLNQTKQYIKGLAGKSINDQKAQLASNFKRNPREVRDHLLQKSKVKIQLDSQLSLALKEYLGLTWAQQKKNRRFWHKLGVSLKSEHKERQIYRKLVKNKVRVDAVTVDTKTGAGTKRKSTPLAVVPDLKVFVFDLLNDYHDQNLLTWHGEGGIPEDEIWLKIGGDHGQGSLKICTQIANLEKPNSREHTHLVAMLEAKDSYEVLKQVIVFLNTEIKKLKQVKWAGKRIKVFLFGDYSFLCNVYGLSGAAGTYPCLWCLSSNFEIKNSKGIDLDRSLSSIKQNHREYLEARRQKNTLQQRKELPALYKNCVRAPLFDIELEMVVPMYLHILLGLVIRKHNFLVAETHIIDEMLAEMYIHSDTYDNMHLGQFDKFVNDFRRLNKLRIDVIDLEPDSGSLTSNELKEAKKNHLAIAKKLSKLEKKLKGKKLKLGAGPVVGTIEETLSKHHIESKAWHGGSFIGNHCNKYLEKEVHTELTNNIFRKTERLTKDKKALDKARSIKQTFDTLFKSYSKVHSLISSSRKIDQSEHDEIQESISTYMQNYRDYFPGKTISPKMHILENHLLPFIKNFGFGFGLLSEQGGELLHASMVRFSTRASGIRNDIKRMKSIVESHHIQISPSLRTLYPVKEERIFKKDRNAKKKIKNR